MTIQEAIKSGKPFKRKGYVNDYFLIIDDNGYFCWADDMRKAIIVKEDIFATDWEIKK